MTAADQQRFAAIVHPLTAWVKDGSVWAVAIQDNRLLDDPVLASADETLWNEVRVETLGDRDGASPSGDWVIRVLFATFYVPERVVYTGRLDRQIFCRVLRNGFGVRDWADLLLS